MATQEQLRWQLCNQLENLLKAKWHTRVLAFFDGLALEVLRKHFSAFDRLLAGVDKESALYKDIHRQQVTIFKHIRHFYETLHAQVSLDNPKYQEIFTLSPAREKEDQMRQHLAQVLKDSLRKFKENMRQSIAEVQTALKNRLNPKSGQCLLAPCPKRILEIQLGERQRRESKLAFKHFIATYGVWLLQEKT
ncbi:hypothetical protein [Helicobacter sp. NHP22-001]|uniref:hypothetical protein n=1 Tax=Helicobacter sp. NHP22-001 TaxID=3040202 RepID=UPI00244D88E7|nr:hypothetical protein [Helicobacter sp. NHP22-001]GMB95516.1 hypothetical protein NHP22001_01050 [Helicobacter sp. NHP22-001]